MPPRTLQAAPDEMLQGFVKAFGKLPNPYATMGHSPAALRAHLALGEALEKGALSSREVEPVNLHASELDNALAILARTEIDFPRAPHLPEA